ncbi:MAG: N-acetylmuramic acid 6-phosphate etherase [Elusimicrobiales bacterium]|nr:N-acetylmuramic acid 6-phosphate etherase [Elusimicrobiales bacterium]
MQTYKKNNNIHKTYASLPTEQINKNTFNIDRIPLRKVLLKLNEEDAKVPKAIKKVINEIEKAAIIVSKTFILNKTTFFIGAGTSGRLGILEASELPPTFGVKPKQFQAIMCGGPKAVFKAKEGAEDIYKDGYRIIQKKGKEKDTLIAIAASGITPYVRGAIDAALKKKMNVIFITANYKEKLSPPALTIAVNVGPEPINGSTRMKSGTATKLILNMITTSAMIISGKVYHNWMIDLKPTNKKLINRAQRVFCQITGLKLNEAENYLKKTKYNLKTAIVMAVKKVDKKKAEILIKKHKGFLKDIIG